jgi:hypothetical protein
MKTAPMVQGLVALFLLASCSTPHGGLDEQQLQRLRTVEVAIDVPDENFVYYGADTARNMPYVPPPSGVSVGTALATNLFFGIVIGSIEQVLTEAARNDSLPVGRSVQDLDLRRMAFGYLQDMAAASTGAPTMSLSIQPFPRVEEPPPVSHAQPNMNMSLGRVRLDPLKPMVERAAASQADATLFVKVLPQFTLSASLAPMVRSAALLYDKSGRLLHTSSVTFVGPPSPSIERSQVVAWWADGRYRRLIAQGLRAVMLPLGEDLTQPGLAAQRRAEMDSAAAQLRAEVTRLESTRMGSAISRVQVSAANALRMRSSVCLVDSEGPQVTYRYERADHDGLLVVSGHCPGETLDLWSAELVPGMSWTREQQSAPLMISIAK